MATRLLGYAPDRFVLGGLSMGGIVAFEAYRKSPQRIAALALLNTTPNADAPSNAPIRRSQIARARKGELATVVQHELKPNYLGQTKAGDEALLSIIANMACRLGVECFVRQSKALMNRRNYENILCEIGVPVALICGEDDTVCPPALHQMMADRIPEATVEAIPGCGHLSSLEAPFAVNAVLHELFNRIT